MKKKKQRPTPIFIHGIQRAAWIPSSFTRPQTTRVFGCRCRSGRWNIVCKRCSNQTPFSRHYGLPLRWIGYSTRETGTLFSVTGSLDKKQFDEVLQRWDIQRLDYRGVKRGEIFIAIRREQVEPLVAFLRRFAVVPSPNRIVETDVSAGGDEADLVGEADDDWTDGTRRVIFQGSFTETTMSLFGKDVRYYLTVYMIGRTPSFPAKVEISFETPPRVYLSECELRTAVKAAGQLLAGIAQGAGVEALDISPWAKMEGEPFTLASKRGCKVNEDWILRTAGLADQIDMGKQDDDSLTRATIRAVFPLCLGRPVTDDDISERLNSPTGRRVFQRLGRQYRYRWIPQTATMARLRAVLRARRLDAENGEPPEAYDAAYSGADDDSEPVVPVGVADCAFVAEQAENEEDEFAGLGDDLFKGVPAAAKAADEDDEFMGLDKAVMIEMGLLPSPPCKKSSIA